MASALIVFSHLRWDFVYQRPQHLLSRLASGHPIVFIEEPVQSPDGAFFHTYSPAPNILVCQPNTPVGMPGFHDDHLPYLQKLLRQLVRDYDDHIAWFYTPMALPLLQELHPRLVVYDCIDALASFRNAPRQLAQREGALLKEADIVFAGGPSLYRSLQDRHPKVHCFAGSVDAAHFDPALDRANSHPAHRRIPGPRLGFHGVIDERFDTELIAQVADAHTQWQIVLVGPVVGIEAASLPRRANIHYLGQQPYQALPQFLAGWDVGLLPFALNESTRSICPVTTLEYMAAELPVVSTPLDDVAGAYGEIVTIADGAPAFIAACEAALLAPPEQHAKKVEKMRKLLASTSWDSTVAQMRALLDSTPRRRDAASFAQPVAAAEAAANVNLLRPHEAVRHAQTMIIGAGAAGLAAAYHLGHDAVLLEKGATVGGGCRSIKDNGFTFDHAGHAMFSDDPYVLELYDTLLGSNVHWQDREACVYVGNVPARYSVRDALNGLPQDAGREGIRGATGVRAARRDGVPPSAPNVASLAKCGTANRGPAYRGPANFEEFIWQAWGAEIAKHCAIPYHRKLWGLPLTEMEPSWPGGRMALPDFGQLTGSALRPGAEPAGPDARFGYPLRGGFQALMSAFVPHIKGTIELNAHVVKVSPQQRMVVLADGRRYQYEHLISTMPLPELVKAIGEEAPDDVRQAAGALMHLSLRCVHLGVVRKDITDKHWIYYPEDTIFHRIFAQGNASPECNAPGGFGITCEISYSPAWKPLPSSGGELIERCIRDCIRVGLLREDDGVIAANEVDMPYAWVVHDHARARNVETVRSWLALHGIVLAGRYGEWENYDSDRAFIAGKKAAESVKWAEPDITAAAAE